MKKLLFFIIFVSLFTSMCFGVIDQSQEQHDSSLFVICADWLFAQTFTAGMSGQLEKVDLWLTNYFEEDLYPCTVSIVDVVDNAPSGSTLGQVYSGSIDGWNSIDFLSESVFLMAGNQYGIVIGNDDSKRYSGISTQWRNTGDNAYSGGAAWVWMPETGWVQSVQPPDGWPVETFYDRDAAFRTYIVPEPCVLLILCLGAFLIRKRGSTKPAC